MIWHKRYTLGNVDTKNMELDRFWKDLVRKYRPDVSNVEGLEDSNCKELLEDELVWTKVYMLDHGYISLMVGETNPFHCPFDSGWAGIACISKTAMGNVKDWRDVGLDLIRARVGTYDAYLNGEVFDVSLQRRKDGSWIEMCMASDVYDTSIPALEDLFNLDIGLSKAVSEDRYETKKAVLRTISYYDYDA